MDQAVFHLINEQWTSPVLDLFMAALSDVGVWQPFIVVLLLYALIFCGFKGRAFVFCVVVTLIFSEMVLVSSLKTAIGRPRPKQAQTVRLVHLRPASPKFLSLFKKPDVFLSTARDRRAAGDGSSFPSGHVANNFVVGTFCVLFFGRLGWLYYIVAALVGYSRIYLGAHWPSDVIATAFMGVGEALLIFAMLELSWRWAAPRWAPRWFAKHPHLAGITERANVTALASAETLPQK